MPAPMPASVEQSRGVCRPRVRESRDERRYARARTLLTDFAYHFRRGGRDPARVQCLRDLME
jgi:hypothetical protein